MRLLRYGSVELDNCSRKTPIAQGGDLGLLVAFAGSLMLAARLIFQWGLRRYDLGNLVMVRN
jgi:hypothetical protein